MRRVNGKEGEQLAATLTGISLDSSPTSARLASSHLLAGLAFKSMRDQYLERLWKNHLLQLSNHPALAGALPSTLPGFVQPYLPSGSHRLLLSQNQTRMATPWLKEGLLARSMDMEQRCGIQNNGLESLVSHSGNKPKRIRTAFSPAQLIDLEEAFNKNQYLVGQERRDLATRLSLSETQVKVWFQNRRTKQKRTKPCSIIHGGDN